MPELPDEVIIDILTRLPVKSLLVFRSVSKPWCSRIDSHQFRKLHLKRSLQSKSNLSLILEKRIPGSSIYSIVFNKLDRAVAIQNPFKHKKVVVSGCCHGLLLLKEVSVSDYRLALLNPATKEHKVIPSSPLFTKSKNGGFPNGGPCALGYDEVNDDYKLFSVVEFLRNGIWVGSEATVYSLKSGTWKPMKDIPFRLPCIKEWGVHLRGHLHTFVIRNGKSGFFPDGILVTDLVKEDYGFMEVPDYRHEDVTRVSMAVFESEELLCVGFCYKDCSSELWLMKEYGEKSSWTKFLTVPSYVVPRYTFVDPLVLPKDSSKVLFCTETKFCWFDLKSEKFDDIPVRACPDGFFVDVCMESLVSPNGYGKKVKKPKKNQPETSQKAIKEDRSKKQRDDFLSKGFKLKL